MFFSVNPAHQSLTCCVTAREGCSGGGWRGGGDRTDRSALEVTAKQQHDTAADLSPWEWRGARLRTGCPGGDGRSAGRALCQPAELRESYFLCAAVEFVAAARPEARRRAGAAGPGCQEVPLLGCGSGGAFGRASAAPQAPAATGPCVPAAEEVRFAFVWDETPCPVCSACLVGKGFGEPLEPVYRNLVNSSLLGARVLTADVHPDAKPARFPLWDPELWLLTGSFSGCCEMNLPSAVTWQPPCPISSCGHVKGSASSAPPFL